MEKEKLILGRVSLNAYTVKDRNKPCRVIEILDGCFTDGEIVVLEILKRGNLV